MLLAVTVTSGVADGKLQKKCHS